MGSGCKVAAYLVLGARSLELSGFPLNIESLDIVII
jgi:hypothetical protein